MIQPTSSVNAVPPAQRAKLDGALDYADLYVPSTVGGYRCVRQIGGHGPTVGAETRFRMTADGVNRIEADGEVLRLLTMEPHEKALSLAGHAAALYVSSDKALYSVDAASGAVQARRPWASYWDPHDLHVRPDGTVMVTDGRMLRTLDANLQPLRERDMGFVARNLQPLPNGLLAVHQGPHGHCLSLLRPDGGEQLRLTDVVGGSLRVEGDRLWCIRRENRKGEGNRSVLWYDAAANRADTTATTLRASGVVPLRNHGFLVLHDESDRSQMWVYDGPHAEPRRFSFQHAGYVRQFFLDEEDRNAYVLLEHYPRLSAPPAERRMMLYRVPLDDARARGRLKPLWQRPVGKFLPALLSDGRWMMFHTDSVHSSAPNGPLRVFRTAEQVREHLGSARLITRRVPLGPLTFDRPADASVEAHMRAVQARAGNQFVEVERPMVPRLAPLTAVPSPAVSIGQHVLHLRHGGQMQFVSAGSEAGFTHAATTGTVLAAATESGSVYGIPLKDPIPMLGEVNRFSAGAPIHSLFVDERGLLCAQAENGNLLVLSSCASQKEGTN